MTAIKIPFTTPGLVVEDKDNTKISVGLTADRATVPQEGQTRVNKDLDVVETFVNGRWIFSSPGSSLGLVITTDTVLTVMSERPVNTTAGPINLTLPAAPRKGDFIKLYDYLGTWDKNYVTIIRNGKNIGGSAANLVLDMEYGSIELTFIDNTVGWAISNSGATLGQRVVAITTASQVLEPWIQYKVTMAAGDRAVKLPVNPRPGHRVTLMDYERKWDQLPILIDGNGKKIEGSLAQYEIREANLHVDLFFMDDAHGWDMVRTASPIVMDLADKLTASKLVLANKRYPVNTTGVAITATLPTGPLNGERVAFYDQTGTWGVNHFSVNFGGSKVDGEVLTSKTYSSKNGAVEFIFDTVAGWKTVNEYSVFVHNTTAKTASFAAVANNSYDLNATSAGITVTMPTVVKAGDRVALRDTGGTWNLNEVRVNTDVDGNKTYLRLTGFYDYVILEYQPSTRHQWVITELGQIGGIETVIITPNFASKNNVKYIVSSVAASGSLALPVNAPNGTWVEVEGSKATLWNNPLVVKAPDDVTITGENIEGSSTVTLIDNSVGRRFVKDGLRWNMVKYNASSGINHLHQSIDINANTNLQTGRTYDVITRSAEITLSLPDLLGNDTEALIAIYDAAGIAGRYRINIDATGAGTFFDGSSRVTLKENFGYVELRWLAKTNRWVICGGKLGSVAEIVRKNSDGGELLIGVEYIINNTTGIPTAKLPLTPNPGDFCRVTEGDRGGVADQFFLSRNGKKINGATEDFKTSESGVTLECTYIDDTFGWSVTKLRGRSQTLLAETVSASKALSSAGFRYPVDSSAALITVTLPLDSKHGEVIELYDMKTQWQTRPLTIAPGTSKINSVTGNRTVNLGGRFLTLIYDKPNLNWLLYGDEKDLYYNTTIQTASFNARTNGSYLVQGNNSNVTVTLPSGPVFGDIVELYDSGATWSTFPITVSGLIDGETTQVRLSGKEGSAVFTYIGATTGWLTSGQNYTLTQEALAVTASVQVLRANVSYLCTTVANAQVTLPINPKRGDIVELSSTATAPWFNVLTVNPNTGDTIEGKSSVKLINNAVKHIFTYAENKWVYSNVGMLDSAGGNVNFATLITANANLCAGVAYTATVNANRTLTLPDMSGIAEPCRVSIAFTDGGNVGKPTTLQTSGAARFGNGFATHNLNDGAKTHIVEFSPVSGNWSLVTDVSNLVLGTGATSTVEVRPEANRLNYHNAARGTAVSFRAHTSFPQGTIIGFTDTLGNCQAGGTMTFLPASGQTVNAAASYVMDQSNGFWVFELVGTDWALIETSAGANIARVLTATTAPTTNVPFTVKETTLYITLNANYALSSIKLPANDSYFAGTILFKQDGTGFRTVSVPSGWRELEDSPGLAMTPNSRSLLQFWSVNGDVVYSVKGDKGADTEFPIPAGYMGWPSTYNLSSLSNDPERSWARLTLTFATNGQYNLTATKNGAAPVVVSSGPYVRTGRAASEYELQVGVNSGTGTVVSESNDASAWVACGLTNIVYQFETSIGPEFDGLMEALRNLTIRTRRITKRRWTLFEKTLTLSTSSKANLPVPPANFNTWINQSITHYRVVKDPAEVTSNLTLEFNPDGSFNIIGSGSGATETKVTGTYVNTGRTANRYEAKVTVQSGTGTVTNNMVSWTPLGGAKRTLVVASGVPAITTGEQRSNYTFLIEVREIAKPTTRTYSGTLTLDAKSTAEAPILPAGFNVTNGGTVTHSKSEQDPAQAWVKVKLIFKANGQLITTKQDNSTGEVVVHNGTYLVPGRAAGQYQLLVTPSGTGGTLTNQAAMWKQLGTVDVVVEVASSIGPVESGTENASYVLNYVFRESGRTSYSYSGNVTLTASATATEPVLPVGFNSWRGNSIFQSVSKTDNLPASAHAYLAFDTVGNFGMYGVDTGTNNPVGAINGKYLLPGRTAANTEVRVTVQSSNGSLDQTTSGTGGAWVTLNAAREYFIGNGSTLLTPANKDGNVVLLVEIRTKSNQRDYYSGTVTLRTKVLTTTPPAPANFNTWIGKSATASHSVQDPDSALAKSWITFWADGNWGIYTQINGNAVSLVTSGVYVLPGRAPTSYEVIASPGATTGTVTNGMINWIGLGVSGISVELKSTFGPARTGTLDATCAIPITIREKANIANSYSGTFTARAVATCTAPVIPANFNSWGGKTVSHTTEGTLPDRPTTATELVFLTNGSFLLRYKSNNAAWADVVSGTYILSGRSAASYEMLVSVTGHTGNTSGLTTPTVNTWVSMGSANLSLTKIISAAADTIGSSSGIATLSITIREKANHAMTYTNTVVLNSTVNVGSRVYPANSVAFFGQTYTAAYSGLSEGGGNSSKIQLVLSANGTWLVRKLAIVNGASQAFGTVANGTFSSTGNSNGIGSAVSGNTYEVKLTKTGDNGNASIVGIPNGVWTRVDVERILDITTNFGVNQIGTINHSSSYTLEIREYQYPNSTYRSGTIVFNNNLVIQDGAPPAGFNNWRGATVSVSDTKQDPTKADCMAFVRFNTNGTWELCQRSGEGAAISIIYSGTYLMPGRNANSYEIIASGTNIGGWGSNPVTGWTTLGASQIVISVQSVVGPVVTGSLEARFPANITIREKANHANTYSGIVNLNATSTTTAPATPSNFNLWRGDFYNTEGTGGLGAKLTVSCRLVFAADGTYRVENNVSNGGTATGVWKLLESGTYLMPGRTASMYEVKADPASHGGMYSPINDTNGGFVGLGAGDVAIGLTSTSVPSVQIFGGNLTFTVVIREKVATGNSYVGTFGGYCGWNIASRTYPADSMNWNTQKPYGQYSITNWTTNGGGYNENSMSLWFSGNGTWSVYYHFMDNNSANENGTMATGTFNATGVPGTAYEYRAIKLSESGGPGEVFNGDGVWRPINNMDSPRLNVFIDRDPGDGNNISYSGEFRIEIREIAYPAETLRTANIVLAPHIKFNVVTPPATFNNWMDDFYKDYGSGVAGETSLRFDANGTFTIIGTKPTGATTTGTWINSTIGRVASDYEIKVTRLAGVTNIYPTTISNWTRMGTGYQKIAIILSPNQGPVTTRTLVSTYHIQIKDRITGDIRSRTCNFTVITRG